MIQPLLALDTSLLLGARTLVGPEYARLIEILWESVVIAGAVTLLGIWLIGVAKHDNEYRKNALRIFMTIIGVFVIYSVVNLGVPQWRPSPITVAGGITPLIPHPIDNSFPSGHALFSIALLVGLWKYYRRYWLIAVIAVLALLTTTARVIGGVHYPGDILGGFFFGGIGAIYLQKVVQSELMEKYVYPVCIKIASWIRL
jgi:membrane-associated phospholipid phosphatase